MVEDGNPEGARRKFLKGMGIAGLAGLAGCQGDGGSEETTTTTTTTTTATTTTSGGGDGDTTTTTESMDVPEVSGTYIDSDSTDAESLNWLTIADEPSDARINPTLDGAYTITAEQEVFPLWCDISSDDKRVYEVQLRENLQWSEPYGQMTAEDWVYTIKNVFQGEENWAGYVNAGDWKRQEEPIPVEKTGTYTFEIQLPAVDPAFPLKPVMWGQYTMPKDLIKPYVEDKDAEGLKKDETINNLGYTGNLGPYSFEKWEREGVYIASRNEDYYMHDVDNDAVPENFQLPEAWQGSPYFTEERIRVIPEESTRLSALRNGEITHAGIPETKVPQFEDLESVNVNISPRAYNTLLVYNQRANGWAPFRRIPVRQALAKAVDKQAIVDNILRGFGDVAHTFQPQWSKWFSDSEVTKSGVGDSYSPQQARQELQTALEPTQYGYEGDTVVDSEGNPVTLRLVYPVGTETTKTAAEYIAQSYGQIGLDVELKGVQFNTLLSKYAQTTNAPAPEEAEWYAGPYNAGNRLEATSAEQWDLHYGIIFNTYPRTPTSTRSFWTQQSPTNYYGYYPEADLASLYDEASQATDDERRQEVLAEIFGILSREQPCNFINFGAYIDGYQSYLEGPEEEWAFSWDANTWHFDRA